MFHSILRKNSWCFPVIVSLTVPHCISHINHATYRNIVDMYTYSAEESSSSSSSSSSSAHPVNSNNPLDCKIPACKYKSDMLKMALRAQRERSEKMGDKEESRPIALGPSDTDSISLEGCPVDKAELGSSTWNLLHTIAANFTDKPTQEEQERMSMFFTILSSIYPCPVCAADFATSIQKSPPRVNSRETLCLWLCELHNEVNVKLGKPIFRCEIRALDNRWKEGEISCWRSEDEDTVTPSDSS